MSIQGILWVTIVLFALAAGGGLIMAVVRISREHNPPSWLAMLHGLLAAAGLTLLLFAAFTVGLSGFAMWALVLLIVAAIAGVFMNLWYHEKRVPLPKPLLYAHLLIATIGFVLLIIGAIA